ncbi:MAG: hypothetical protein FJX77_12880 [Armatimonadetes bacterium]|nr:hypothetical protein [Armatimonadota bacterium]
MSAGARPQPADLAPLHWPITAAALGAFAAFADSRGAPGALPLVAMVLVAAHLAPARRRPGGSAGAASESGGTAETPTRAPVPATSAWPLRSGAAPE